MNNKIIAGFIEYCDDVTVFGQVVQYFSCYVMICQHFSNTPYQYYNVLYHCMEDQLVATTKSLANGITLLLLIQFS